jgi:hypothetical protein
MLVHDNNLAVVTTIIRHRLVTNERGNQTPKGLTATVEFSNGESRDLTLHKDELQCTYSPIRAKLGRTTHNINEEQEDAAT